MVNGNIIALRLKEIDENVGLLLELKKKSKTIFCGDPRIYKLAERCLEVSIQSILDIAHHLIVENDWKRPIDNKEAILVLGENGVLPKKFAEKIMPMAGLRNILVHEYTKIDPEKIYIHLTGLDDFKKFQKCVMKYQKV